MFDPVIIAADQGHMDVAFALRGVLELFRLQVYLHQCVQKRNVLELFAGCIPESEYVVLAGLASTDRSSMKLAFRAVDQVDGRWSPVEVELTPESIPELVHLPGRRIVTLGCLSGREPLARAFVEAGCATYIGAEGSVDQDSCALFAITFFYHLLSAERDPSAPCSEREAFERAAAADPGLAEGTGLFRYYAGA